MLPEFAPLAYAAPAMTLHLPTLAFACAVALAMSAGVMTMYGLSQRTYRGYWWWVGAQWGLTLGLLLQLLRDVQPLVLPLANALMLQWPIVLLAGMRRFASRNRLNVPPRTDWLLLAACLVAWLAAWTAGADLPMRVAVFAACSALLHGYTALLLTRLTEFGSGSALRALVGTQALVVSVEILRVVAARPGGGVPWIGEQHLLATGLAAVLAALLATHLAFLLTNERTEANLLAMQRKLRYLADMDVLTRVPNRRHFHELSNQVLIGREDESHTLMMFDIDHFKRINDTLGHARGDEALRQVARCVRDSLRGQDVPGRLGGDEFAVLLPGTQVQDAMAVALRISIALEACQPDPAAAPLSLSFGMVQLHDGEAVVDALRRADQALYEAKRQGRSRAVIATGVETRPVFGTSRPMGLSAG